MRLGVLAASVMLALGQTYFPGRFASSASVLTASNFTYDGMINVGWNGSTGDMDFDTIALTGRIVSGHTHLLLSQTNTAGYVGRFSPIEFDINGITPALTLAGATQAPLYCNWGTGACNGSGGVFDTYGGLFGKSYATAEYNPNTQSLGDDYTISNAYIAGMGYHDNGSGHCCLYVSYSSPYGNINPEWNLLAVDLPVGGPAVAYGPWRNENGESVYGSGTKRRGAQRTYYMLDNVPGGGFCHGSSNGYTAQGQSNQGPSLFCSASWPQPGDASGYGTSRTGDGGRSTDIVATDTYLAHFGMYGLLAQNGTLPGGQDLLSATRPSLSGGATVAYVWENDVPTTYPNVTSDTSYDLDPLKNSNAGSWTTNDSATSCNWVDITTAKGLVCSVVLATSHEWYRTTAAKTALIDGVTPVTFDRNTSENVWATALGGQRDITYQAVSTGQHVTVAYVNPAANNQALSISVSSPAVTVHLATNGSGAITSTAGQISTLWASTGSATALATATITGDGTGVVSAFAAELVAGGPAYCPRHNVDAGILVTGPTSAANVAAFYIYDTNTLTAVKNAAGAIEPYSPTPANVAYIKADISGASAMQTVTTGYRKENIGPAWYDATNRKLYLIAVSADLTSNVGTHQPIVHVFSVQ